MKKSDWDTKSSLSPLDGSHFTHGNELSPNQCKIQILNRFKISFIAKIHDLRILGSHNLKMH